MPDTQEPISVKEFSSKIKAKYPEYKDVDDNVLAKKIVEKYPEYKDKVSFGESAKQIAEPTKQTVDKPAPKGGVFKSIFGEVGKEKQVSESTSAPKVEKEQKELTKLINTVPALKKQKIQDVTLDRLIKSGKPPLVGSNSYNDEQLKVSTEIKPQEYLPSYFLKPSKIDIRKEAIDKFSKINNEGSTEVESKLASGDYIFEDGTVKKKGDFLEMMGQGVVNFADDIVFALKAYGAQSDGEMLYHINQHNKEKENKIEFGANDFAGKSGEMIGSILPYVVGDGAMSLATLSAEGAGKLVAKKFTSELFEKYALEQAAKKTTESALGEASEALVGFAPTITKPDVAIMGFSNMGSNMSAIASDENLTPQQKVDAIKGAGADFFMTGAAQGVLFNSIPDVAHKTTAQDLLQKYYPTSDLRYKFTQKLISGYKDLLKATPKDIGIAASIGGGTEVINSMTKAREGVKVDLSAVPEGALSIATLELIMKAPKVLAHAYSTIKESRNSNYDKINPGWFNEYNSKTQDALNAIVSAPEALYKQSLEVLSKSDSPSIAEAKAKIQEFRQHYNSLPSELTAAEKNKALHIIQLKHEATVDMKSATDKSVENYYENRIKAYDKLLGNLIDKPSEFKTDDPLLKKRLDEPVAEVVEPKEEYVPTEEHIQANAEATPEQRIEAEKQARLAQEQELKQKQDDTTGISGEDKGLTTEVPANVLRDLGESSRKLTDTESGAVKAKIAELGGDDAARKLFDKEGNHDFAEPYEVFLLKKHC
jgi:hypothetical protein